ncbi:hypothetical protein [Dorea longicatena]|jgi:hypothetical protein|uniref:hypothetical protein n=1 Tax=Dorea longicatena TaxID=88431 RepID=UPI0014869248|nr:hypothetical protein [Dorea longicatena]
MNNNTGRSRKHKGTKEKGNINKHHSDRHHINEYKGDRGLRIYAEAKTRSDEDLQIF